MLPSRKQEETRKCAVDLMEKRSSTYREEDDKKLEQHISGFYINVVNHAKLVNQSI